MNSTVIDEADPIKWNLLYRISGYAAIVMVLIIPVQIAIFSMSPMPDSVESWFELFHNNWIICLIHSDLLYIINNILVAIMYLAFYFSLRRINESLYCITNSLDYLCDISCN